MHYVALELGHRPSVQILLWHLLKLLEVRDFGGHIGLARLCGT